MSGIDDTCINNLLSSNNDISFDISDDGRAEVNRSIRRDWGSEPVLLLARLTISKLICLTSCREQAGEENTVEKHCNDCFFDWRCVSVLSKRGN